MNRFQSRKIKGYLNDNRMSLDELQQGFVDALTINQLTNAEASALFIAIMRNIMQRPHNAEQLKTMGIDPTKLGIDAVTELMVLWAKEYVKTL